MRLRPAGGEFCRAWHPGGAYQLAIGGGGVDVAGAAAAVVQARRAAGLAYSPRELARYQDNPLIPQGASSELMNKRFGLTREALDAFAVRSHRRATEASQAGRVRINWCG